MSADLKVEMNDAGAQELLRSREVEADLLRRARRIASAAGQGYEADSSVGSVRARATVWTNTIEARRDEATNHSLVRALDAGR